MGTENKTFGVAEAVLLRYPCVQIGCKAVVRGSELRECETAQRGLTQRTPGTTEISGPQLHPLHHSLLGHHRLESQSMRLYLLAQVQSIVTDGSEAMIHFCHVPSTVMHARFYSALHQHIMGSRLLS